LGLLRQIMLICCAAGAADPQDLRNACRRARAACRGSARRRLRRAVHRGGTDTETSPHHAKDSSAKPMRQILLAAKPRTFPAQRRQSRAMGEIGTVTIVKDHPALKRRPPCGTGSRPAGDARLRATSDCPVVLALSLRAFGGRAVKFGVLGARCPVLGARCPVLGARCSVLGARGGARWFTVHRRSCRLADVTRFVVHCEVWRRRSDGLVPAAPFGLSSPRLGRRLAAGP
jgi:hypothetical protein